MELHLRSIPSSDNVVGVLHRCAGCSIFEHHVPVLNSRLVAAPLMPQEQTRTVAKETQ
jgi:hypothetical protein